ncbi:type VII secretion-associated protein [Mycolicibacterium houstonense]|uniref:type VII secretion-associated protein n=1 Tax=Mycolicibacterium houstonense TaxID=146021 RepID=UPI00082DF7B8|nr:type VII secretion-associated protein [Mycolicibacterium houstonense]
MVRAAVIEAGPVSVRGPGPVPADRAAAAVAGIDDEIVLVGDELVTVPELWAEVLDAAAAGAPNLTVVCPSHWTARNRERVRAAGGAEVAVIQRFQALSAPLASTSWVVVEIADDVVTMTAADAEPVMMARHLDAELDPEMVVRTVMAMAGVPVEVSVDAPPEVAGARVLGESVVAGLRRRGVVAALADAQRWRDVLDTPESAVGDVSARPVRRGRPVVCAALALAVTLGGIALAGHGLPAGEPAMTVLVEGRVGMRIPAGWTVDRVTDGPGSARVQVVSPSDPQVMVHLTQSGVGDGPVAEILYRALREQPPGVFTDFDPAAVVAARQVVSYREVRAGREIRWAVFVDGPVRIAIGCQCPPGGSEAVRSACEAAIRSAHVVS